MAKTLEVLGLALIAVMTLSFVGAFRPSIEAGLSPLFWGCAGAALLIIMYRKMRKKQEDADQDLKNS